MRYKLNIFIEDSYIIIAVNCNVYITSSIIYVVIDLRYDYTAIKRRMSS